MPEIIPKEYKKELEPNFLFYFSIVILAISVLVYFSFFSLTLQAEKKIREIEYKKEIQKTEEQKKLEEEIILYAKKLRDIKTVLKDHLFTSRVFEFLEASVHPKVVFNKFSLDANENKFTLEGTTDNFYTLGQQILLFQKEPLINKVEISQIGITKEGKVNFVLGISFNPQLIKR